LSLSAALFVKSIQKEFCTTLKKFSFCQLYQIRYTVPMLRLCAIICSVLLFAGGALFLTACTQPPKVEDQTIVPIQQQTQRTQQTQEQTQTQDQTQQQSQDQQPQNQPSSLQHTSKGPIVKTLKDFEKITATQATITTAKGDITFTLFPDKVPLTVTNFLTLAKSGFYDGIKFHRIIPDFMAQVGDPLTKDDSKKDLWGTGGPGYTIEDEFDPTLKHDTEGTVSMANTGQPATGGSQFFITFGSTPWLDGKHAVFGKVISGMDVLRKLEIGDSITKVSFQ
jgi:cyclophilin family peptidyl-prolyl cis-trans isomerase